MKRKNNLKLYPIYKMFSWDLLFYYAIALLFLTGVKGLSVSQVLFADAFYPLFKISFQIICVSIVDHIGKRKSLLFGNIFVSASILILILGKGISALFISNLVMSIGYVLKELCEPTFLHNSIPEAKSKADIFSKLDGKGNSYYYLLGSISSFITGFLFVVNSYLPIIICFTFCLIGTLIALKFQEIETEKVARTSSALQDIKIYFKDLKYAFKFILKSRRLKSLLMFSSLMYSLFCVFSTFRSSLLIYLDVSVEYFGIIHGIALFVSAISSKKQQWFHKTFKNRTLTWFSLPITISLILIGLFIICNFNIYLIYSATTLMLLIIYIVNGPYFTLISRYYNNFSSAEISTKIYAAKSIIESSVRTLMLFFASFILEITNIAYAFVIFGCILTVAFIFLLDYMKTRIGLKPEEYKKRDIEFILLK